MSSSEEIDYLILKAKFYFPLIGSDPVLQKQILEDDNNIIKIKLKKIKKYKDRKNYELISPRETFNNTRYSNNTYLTNFNYFNNY